MFVDGVRRLEARIWIDEVAGTQPASEASAALCASYAAGTVCCCPGSGAHLLTAEVRRGLFTVAGHATDVVTTAGTYTASHTKPDPAQGLAVTLSAALQRRLAEVELLTANNARAALIEHTEAEDQDLLIIDGPLRGRQHLPRTLGFIKSHRAAYLPPELHALVGKLNATERTPVFLMGTSWERFSWYLRLPCLPAAPWAGVVRLECSSDIPPPAAWRWPTSPRSCSPASPRRSTKTRGRRRTSTRSLGWSANCAGGSAILNCSIGHCGRRRWPERFPIPAKEMPEIDHPSCRSPARHSSYPDRIHQTEEEAMKYIMLIYQGPALERQAALPEEEQKQVYADYQGINQTPGVTPGPPMGLPENATTVRVEGGKTLTTDGPFVGMKEAVGGWFILEADDLDAAIEVAARVPAARYGGAVEIRPSRCTGSDARRIFREEWGRVLATLIGFLGDFDLAEEAAQEAFAIAARPLAARRRAEQPARLADDDGPEPGHGSHPPRAGRRDQVRPARRGQPCGGADEDHRSGRAPGAHLHLLPPGARGRGAGGAHAAHPRLDLKDFRYLHSTRAELLRRLGRTSEARESYVLARALTVDGAERRFLEHRLTELATS